MALSWKTAVAALAVGVVFHATNDFRPVDSYWPSASVDAAVDGHFSETYYQARALFRDRARAANAALYTLPLPHLAHLDLSVDVAVIAGANDNVLLHLSGTHGVEGFAGSAIQSKLLVESGNWTVASGPTVVLVHAVNPFGFAQLRRTNENNVDLNRNWLSAQAFADAKASDPNQHGYDDVFSLINPQPSGGVLHMHLQFVTTLARILTTGMAKVKSAMVAATYHYQQGLFFGGFEKQPSLNAIEQFLTDTIKMDALTTLTIVDVHTGLGPSGVDTLILTPVCNTAVAEQIFASENAAGLVASTTSAGNAVTAGYASTKGFVPDGIASLFPAKHHDKLVTIAQEFGTVPMPFVTKALIEENAFFNHAPTRRLPFAEKLRDVFYVHQSAAWRKSILDRGMDVFAKLYAHAAK